jgi:hypothetical protein
VQYFLAMFTPQNSNSLLATHLYAHIGKGWVVFLQNSVMCIV